MAFFRKNKEQPEQASPQYAEGLPEMCYSMLPGPKQLICIRRGADHFHFAGFCDENGDNASLAEQLNRKMGITTAQRRAMECGLIYGWDSPEADPQRYDPQPGQQMGGMSL